MMDLADTHPRELSYLHSTHSVCMGRYGGEPVQCSTEQLGHGTFAQAREPGGRRWAHLSKAGVRRYSLVTDKMALIRLSVDRGGRLPLAGHFNSQKISASNLPGRPRTRVGRGSCRNKAGPDHCFDVSLDGDGGWEEGKSSSAGSQTLTPACAFFP